MFRAMRTHAILAAVPAAAISLSNPGVGMKKGDVKPFKDWYKDGFSLVDCVVDDMLLHGDKHGDNKAAYKVGETAGVSIVHYTDIVPKMDRKDMTHEVCYEFCRTIEGMGFFGITNGRDCYCTPFYHQAAGDSSECDAPCDGDSATMCGGKVKSSMFSMHLCDDAKDNLKKAIKARDEATDALAKITGKVADASKTMQSVGATLQKAFGKVGDSAASGQMQDAKAFAGELEAAAKGGKETGEKAGKISTNPKSDALPKIEAVTASLTGASSDAEAETKELTRLLEKAVAPAGKGSDKLYYPAMYFVDKKFQDVPQTCGGEASAKPLLGSIDECAEACEGLGSVKCVGFQFYPEEKGLCVLFSKVSTAVYYTGCKKAAFLQAPAADTKCMLRFSNFEGTSIKPDPSGKCKGCLKEAKKADRCFQ